uniref:Odorant receptor n=1 Tax=Phlebotomus papatasi TaxID=29031 RepID=A0A3F2ZEP7_PHLPP
MADLTKCYSEFIRIENFLNVIMKIVNLSLFRRKILFGLEKYTFLGVLIYYGASTFIAAFYIKGTIVEAVMVFVMIVGVVQMIVKFLVPLTSENELNELLLWIRGLHKDHTFDLITKSAGIHFHTIQFIIKIFHKIIFGVYLLATIAVAIFAIYTNSVLHAIPGIPVKYNESNVYHHIHQGFILPSLTFLLTPSEYILITIGFYFIAIQNVFHDMIIHLDSSNLKNKKQFLRTIYIFHCKILKKFKIFNDIYFYVFTIQAGSSALFIMLLFYIMRIETNLIFIPFILGIYFQFALLCIFGEIIFSKSEEIFIDLYLTKWYDFDLSDQKVFLMMMRISKYPFGLKAAGMYDINIVMFIQVIKAGFSFCAILYTFT